MMKKILISAIILSTMLNSSCKKDDIDTFKDQRYIYINFVKDAPKQFSYTFITTTANQDKIAIPLTYSGRLLTEDLKYSIEIDQKLSDILPSEYDMPTDLIFRAGSYQDTLFVTLNRTERMKAQRFRLNIKLATNENFLASMRDVLMTDIYVSDKIDRPAWWAVGSDVEQYYLGKYTDKKFALFITKGYAGDYGELQESNKRMYAKLFKTYLEENPTKEDDGTNMTVPVN